MIPSMSAEQMLETLWTIARLNWCIAASITTDDSAETLAIGMEMLLRQFTDEYPPIPYSTLIPQGEVPHDR